jgi:hypothetical protein
MNFKCLLGFHKWEIDKEKFVLKCERCGKQGITPELAIVGFTKKLVEIQLKSAVILALLMHGRIEETKAKLEEWKREVFR